MLPAVSTLPISHILGYGSGSAPLTKASSLAAPHALMLSAVSTLPISHILLRIRIPIRMWGLKDPDLDPANQWHSGMDPDPHLRLKDPDPDPANQWHLVQIRIRTSD